MGILDTIGTALSSGVGAVTGAIGDGLGYLGEGMTGMLDNVGLGSLFDTASDTTGVAADAAAGFFGGGNTIDTLGNIVSTAPSFSTVPGAGGVNIGNAVSNATNGLGDTSTFGFGDMFKEIGVPAFQAWNAYDANQTKDRIVDAQLEQAAYNREVSDENRGYKKEDRDRLAKRDADTANAGFAYNNAPVYNAPVNNPSIYA